MKTSAPGVPVPRSRRQGPASLALGSAQSRHAIRPNGAPCETCMVIGLHLDLVRWRPSPFLAFSSITQRGDRALCTTRIVIYAPPMTAQCSTITICAHRADRASTCCTQCFGEQSVSPWKADIMLQDRAHSTSHGW